MSLHIGASAGQIAETVLISGDPIRAKFIAGKILTDVVCYNELRGMLGFTGTYNGKRVSVQGTGMGIPSTAIYVHELIHEHGVKKIIRIGTCGAIQSNIKLGALILAEAAFTDSNTNLIYHQTMDSPSLAGAAILKQAKEVAAKNAINIEQGTIFSTDTFYGLEENRWDKWIQRRLLGVEMETSILYAMANHYKIQALSILTVSDNIITKEFSTSKSREEVSQQMIQLALEIA